MNKRRNVRADLQEFVRLKGTDRSGNPFEIQAESLDFSRKGLGLLVDRDVVAPGTMVSVDLPQKLKSKAVVQWSRPVSPGGAVRIGVRLINPQVSMRFRMVACCLLAMALLSQVCFPRNRSFMRSDPRTPCTVSLSHMKSVIESTLGKYVLITESEKAFIHIQHQKMSCDKYTNTFEKSNFYGDAKKCNAVSLWHWRTYHAEDETVRASAVHDAELTMGAAQ